jgi:hypothetical protein
MIVHNDHFKTGGWVILLQQGIQAPADIPLFIPCCYDDAGKGNFFRMRTPNQFCKTQLNAGQKKKIIECKKTKTAKSDSFTHK